MGIKDSLKRVANDLESEIEYLKSLETPSGFATGKIDGLVYALSQLKAVLADA